MNLLLLFLVPTVTGVSETQGMALYIGHSNFWQGAHYQYIGEHGQHAGLVFDNCNAHGYLRLRTNVRVISTANLTPDLPNGTQGRVVGFRHANAARDELRWGPQTVPEHVHGVCPEDVTNCYPMVNDMAAWPVVEFVDRQGVLITRMTIFPQWFEVTAVDGSVICKRMQLPLALAVRQR